MARVLRVLRWPVALVAVCIALAVFVYFLMPDNMDRGRIANGTYWEQASAASQGSREHVDDKPDALPQPHGTKTPEIDFYDADNEKVDFTSIIDTITEKNQKKLPVEPVFPKHITPEVQYGNEKADSENLRTAKALDEARLLPQDSTLKPHITQNPEKPLAVYFKEGNAETTSTIETISRAETINDFANYGDKQTTKIVEEVSKSYGSIYKEPFFKVKPLNIKQYLVTEPQVSPEVQEYYGRHPVNANFTSGHSNLFGISIEDAEKMRSTTQNSLYNTRVSPTLPTWRDRDDATTKKYPVHVNYEVPQCRSTRQAFCRGVLPYDLAGSPATIEGIEVTSLLPQIEYLATTNCSDRLKHFACTLMEPECSPPPYPPKMPCYSLCRAIMDSCEDVLPRDLIPVFRCEQYSRLNCIAARSPCYPQEFTCRDHTCVPKEWVCDRTRDCPNGEDEFSCNQCEKNEYRCKTGTCVLKRWLCDGYADCPGGEDETGCDRHVTGELGEESAGSAPAPAVRRPNVMPAASHSGDLHRTGEMDSSKELLITSDSSNIYKRNFTRRPSPSRLSPYTRTTMPPTTTQKPEITSETISSKRFEPRKKPEIVKTTQKPENTESQEAAIIEDLGLFDEIKKTSKEVTPKSIDQKAPRRKSMEGRVPPPATTEVATTKLDKSINKLEKVINGAALLKKSLAEEEADSPETKSMATEKEELPIPLPRHHKGSKSSSVGARASPCPLGELRCVDGRCITLAQLCDGTIDCTDHADEDNCYT